MGRPSDIVKCDGCNTHGRRRAGYMVPDGWFYIESVVSHSVKRRVHVVYACSESCRDGMWRRGPGPNCVDERGTMRMRAEENAVKSDRCGDPSVWKGCARRKGHDGGHSTYDIDAIAAEKESSRG